VTLSELSIQRPVFATVCSLLLVLFGAVAFTFLGVREYPAVDPPVISVSANYPGASPEVVASQVTEPLEQQINGIDGVRVLSSTSSAERSQIRVEFQIGADLEAAANDVRDRVSRAIRSLPPEVDPPVVDKADADSEPILFVAVQSTTRDILEVNDFADRVIRERVQTIPGVASVRIFGEKRYAMRLWMDPVKLAAHGLTPLDVQDALAAQNVDLPSGRLEGNTVEIGLRTASRLTTEDEFNSMILKEEGGRQIQFRDVGRAELGAQNLRGGNKSDLLPLVSLSIIPQPNTNAIAIADEFYLRIEDIKRDAPPDISIETAYDFTTFVRRAIREVEETVFFAFALVVLIIYAFLRSWRSTVIPVIAIPVSIISAFFIMYLAGFTINVLTLVGIVLSIGLVCDDAIIVLENIYTKVERGMSPLAAALEGSKEIYFAVISTTITLAAVFVPIVFLEGLTGRLFREFGAVEVGSVLVSAFVALSLSPMMCRFMLRRSERPGRIYAWSEPFFEALIQGYRRSLGAFLARRWLAFPVVAVSAAAIALFWGGIRRELAPLEDRANIRIQVRAPEGASYEYTTDQMDRISVYLRDSIPEIERYFAISAQGGSVNTGAFNLYLTEPDQRARSQEQVFQQLSSELEQFTGVRSFPAQPPTIGDRRAGQPVQYVLQSQTLEDLIAVLPKFLDEASASPALRFVDTNLKINRPEGSISIDRLRAAELGASIREIARTLQLAYGGQRFGTFLRNERQYDVIGQVERGDRNDPGDLAALFVRGRDGAMISLDNLVTFSEGSAAASIYNFNRFTSATISAGLAPGATIGDGITALDEVAARVLPETIRTSLTGQSRDFYDASSSLLFAFGLALALIYLVLAAQFESFLDPLIILVTVPLSVAGALGSLLLFGQTLNIFSQIGIIMLIGLVTKNGILLVEFANQRKEAGLSVLEAALESASARLRPILMTSLATVLGILPIALSLGQAAGSRQSLGIAVVGGLLFSTLLTLYVVPAVYSYLSRERAHSAEASDATPRPALTEPGWVRSR
jgi:multidrug efflux pump